jgi:hypothetical protein
LLCKERSCKEGFQESENQLRKAAVRSNFDFSIADGLFFGDNPLIFFWVPAPAPHVRDIHLNSSYTSNRLCTTTLNIHLSENGRQNVVDLLRLST